MSEKDFYLGRLFDPAKGTVSDQPLLYDPADLTTHAIVTGMTGSGKTGLCIGLLEEAALQGVPALIVDPKGDLTNLLLHFPDLLPADFQPWIDPEIVRRQGQTPEAAAEGMAATWKKGLGDWGIQPERIRALKNAAHFAVYTPGSNAGLQISILSSLDVPPLDWEQNREILRERITSTVTALLGLVGMDDVDPLRSREHILLANIFENAWSTGHSLDLTELILQVQTPPFEKLGAFPVENFFSKKDRTELAMLLNNILAAPAFEAWREGQAFDIPALLFGPDGRPRHTIFYLAHLSEDERMFFVTLLFSAFETWMRTQSGSTSLRALLYMDEIFGYLPPTANPPSKTPLLRMLKQARAFGVGLMLATQNPVDVDYKALSNAGTWVIGKLQTEQDKQRLLDGLQSAAGGLDRGAYDKMISALGKRVFLLHNVHEKQPVVFQTRWVMNYLAGPLTRTQIPGLNALAGAEAAAPAAPAPVPAAAARPAAAPAPVPAVAAAAPVAASAAVRPAAPASSGGSLTRQAVPVGVAEFFLPVNHTLSEAFKASGEPMPPDARQKELLYRPALLSAAQVRFLDRKLGVDSELVRAALVHEPDRRGVVRWEEFPYSGPALDTLDTAPVPQARFAQLDAPLDDAKILTALQRDFTDWVYRTTSIKARANEALKVYAGPDVSQAEFMKACADSAREARDAELAKLNAAFDRKLSALQTKLAGEERELRQDEADLNARRLEEAGKLAENVLGLVAGRKSSSRLSSSLSKRRMTSQAKEDVDESIEVIADLKKQIADLQAEQAAAVAEVNARWGDVVNDITDVTLTPKKTDIFVNYYGVAWAPFYVIETQGESFELPAFGEG